MVAGAPTIADVKTGTARRTIDLDERTARLFCEALYGEHDT